MSIKKQIAIDSLLNIVATSIPLVVLQFVVLPRVNIQIGSNEYGLALTLVSVFNLVAVTTGNTLNNVRLLRNGRYVKEETIGDFNLIVVFLSLIDFVIVALFAYVYIGRFDVGNVLGTAVVSVLLFWDSYYTVGFRLQLNYKLIVINKGLLGAGYCIGFIVFLLSNEWYTIYLCGYTVSCLFLIKKTELVREPLRKTRHLLSTLRMYVVLILSSLLGNLATYFDRLILFPLMGGTAVAIYYSAAVLGKSLVSCITPITGVILSYLSVSKEINRNSTRVLVVSGLIVGALGFVVCVLISRPVITLLYPDLVNDAMNYAYIVSLTAVIQMQCSILNPVLLRFYNTNWQIATNLLNVMLYLILSIALYTLYGLFGFCVGVLVACLSKYFLMLLVCVKAEASDD